MRNSKSNSRKIVKATMRNSKSNNGKQLDTQLETVKVIIEKRKIYNGEQYELQ